MLNPSQISRLKEAIDTSTRPLIFFDGDNDGLTSFLQFYRYKKDGKGIILKTTPNITKQFLRTVEEYAPDTLFVFDIALLEQEFIDGVKQSIYWFDHHGPYERSGSQLNYVNPLLWGQTTSPCVMIYQILEQDMWISALGAIADHQFPYFWKDFVSRYPQLAEDREYHGPFDVRFNTPLGKLIKIFSFNLKGTASEAMKSIKILTRISSPEEILEQQTAQGRFLYKKYEKMNAEYEKLRARALKAYNKEDPFFFFKYTEQQTSFTKDLADDLMYHHPDKVIVLAREREGWCVMSIRTSEQSPEIRGAVEKALVGCVGASGGGHARACGSRVKSEDFDGFLCRLREELSF